MSKYIIFTNNDYRCFPTEKIQNPFTLMGIDAFGKRNSMAVIGNHPVKKAVLITTLTFNFEKYDILLLSDININDSDSKDLITKFIKDSHDVQVLLHSGTGKSDDINRKEEQKNTLKKILGNDFDRFIEQSHNSNSIYWNELIEIANCVSSKIFDENKYYEILKRLKSYWPNLVLESLIHLYKTLSLLQLKGENIIPDDDIIRKDKKYELAFQLISSTLKQNNSIDEILDITSKKIIELSVPK